MTLLRTRQALHEKIDDLKRNGAAEADQAVIFIRQQIARVDREMLAEELDRIAQEKRYQSHGETLSARLGADAWLSDFLPPDSPASPKRGGQSERCEPLTLFP